MATNELRKVALDELWSDTGKSVLVNRLITEINGAFFRGQDYRGQVEATNGYHFEHGEVVEFLPFEDCVAVLGVLRDAISESSWGQFGLSTNQVIEDMSPAVPIVEYINNEDGLGIEGLDRMSSVELLLELMSEVSIRTLSMLERFGDRVSDKDDIVDMIGGLHLDFAQILPLKTLGRMQFTSQAFYHPQMMRRLTNDFLRLFNKRALNGMNGADQQAATAYLSSIQRALRG